MNPIPANRGAEPLKDSESRQLATDVELCGDRAVAEAIGLSRMSLARAIAGMRVRRGTLALIREYLRNRREAA